MTTITDKEALGDNSVGEVLASPQEPRKEVVAHSVIPKLGRLRQIDPRLTAQQA